METQILLVERFSAPSEVWLAILSFAAIIGLLGAGAASLFSLRKNILKKEKRISGIIHWKTKKYTDEIVHLKKANEKLEMLSSVALYTDSGVIITNENGKIIWVNPNFTNKTGYTLEKFKNTHGNTIMEASCHPNIIQIINDALRMKKSIMYESYAYTKNCKKFYISSLLTPIFDEGGELKRFVVIDTDISKYVELKNNLNNIGNEFLEYVQTKIRAIA